MYVAAKYFDIEKTSDEFKNMLTDEKVYPAELEGFKGGLIIPEKESEEFKDQDRRRKLDKHEKQE